jgi:phosphate transport system substrate-binding protein
VECPKGVASKGSEGPGNAVMQIDGSIAYLDYSLIRAYRAASVDLLNRAGRRVRASPASVQAAATDAAWAHDAFPLIPTDPPGEASWPISGASFILMPSNPTDPAASMAALQFFDWAYRNGSQAARDFDYVPLPMSLIRQAREAWRLQIQGPGADRPGR